MKKTILVLLVLIEFMSVTEAQVITGNLIVLTDNLKHNNGYLFARLYRKDDEIFTATKLEVKSIIKNGSAKIIFKNIPFDDYALFLFHDEDSNNEITHNWIGFPSEPMGFSNNFRVSIFSGKPSFEDLRFTFKQSEQTLNVDID